MATITAKNIGRINVWPTYAVAQEADTAESKFTGQLTVWRTNEEAKANISHEEGGGGGAPDWVPANAVIHIDLVGGSPQGRAWVEGIGVVAVETLLGSDPNTENAWDETLYDPANLNAAGYSYDQTTSKPLAFIGAARTMVLDAATTVLRMTGLGESGIFIAFELVSEDGDDGIAVEKSGANIDIYSWNGSANGSLGAPNFGTGTLNCIAVTITGTRLDGALNGGDAIGFTLDDTDRPASNPLVAIVLDAPGVIEPASGCAISSITLYDPLPSTAGLSELSEV